MKKIGIITQLTYNSTNSTNYGNKLQAYALNKYINDNFSDYIAYTIILNNKEKHKYTKNGLLYFLYSKFVNLKKPLKKSTTPSFLLNRRKLFDDFVNNNLKNKENNVKWSDLKKSTYDIFIVGSDVVWAQSNHSVNRIKFLDFKNKNNYKKISYAASFGRDMIPKQNIAFIKKCLKSFNNISVREISSLEMLNNIGINNAKHVVDPTLLLSIKDWVNIEKNPQLTKNKFIFVYLLSKSKKQRDFITKIAAKKGLIIINIPHADSNYNEIDDEFGDIRFTYCSPENWLWLIHNAQYVFTDSFHGLVLSTIYNKNFIILRRESNVDINNRLLDYLRLIGETDKLIDLNNVLDIDNKEWNYKKINNRLEKKIRESKQFISEALSEE